MNKTVSETTALSVQNLTFGYGATPVLREVCLFVRPGEFVGIIGPNGSGKSTLLKNIYGSLTPNAGEILLYGRRAAQWKRKDFSMRIAVVGQENAMPFNFSVREIVAMGRTPHKKMFEPDTVLDWEIVDDAIAKMNLTGMADREFATLSGGEKQRVLIARALAQKTDFLVLDEPTNHLDICHQLQIFSILREMRLTILAAIHDLNLAALYCDRIYVLNDQAIAANGDTNDVINKEMIANIFNVRADVQIYPATGRKHIVYIPEVIELRERQEG